MNRKISCILLVDDNPEDNFIHERIIKKGDFASKVITVQNAMDGLNYLRDNGKQSQGHPDLVFLDINMPGLNGWEFLEKYSALPEDVRSKVVIVMLSTSDSPDDINKAKANPLVSLYRTKPLTKEILQEIANIYFSP